MGKYFPWKQSFYFQLHNYNTLTHGITDFFQCPVSLRVTGGGGGSCIAAWFFSRECCFVHVTKWLHRAAGVNLLCFVCSQERRCILFESDLLQWWSTELRATMSWTHPRTLTTARNIYSPNPMMTPLPMMRWRWRKTTTPRAMSRGSAVLLDSSGPPYKWTQQRYL